MSHSLKYITFGPGIREHPVLAPPQPYAVPYCLKREVNPASLRFLTTAQFHGNGVPALFPEQEHCSLVGVLQDQPLSGNLGIESKEMAFAPPKNTEGAKLQTKMSTWTPLNHPLMNDKVFEERRALLGKWFDKWSDAQRRRVLCDLFERCSVSQLRFCSGHLEDKAPRDSLDFCTVFPRVLSLYIFSFLDPRSLCRCAQVSWYWKTLTELDQLWMPKCLRFGWYINFSPSPFEQGVWKRQYIEMVKELHVTRPKTPPRDDFVVIDVQPITKEVSDPKLTSSFSHRSVRSHDKEKKELPPWRSSDKHPTDTIRFNYLDNFSPIEQSQQARKSSAGTSNLNKQNSEKKKTPTSASYKLRKAKSLMMISSEFGNLGKPLSRPSWAALQAGGYPVSRTTAKELAQSTEWNAGIRPAPVRAGVPKLSEKGKKACARTSRSSPTISLFESQPWQVPTSDED
ncbi:F-box only protein 16 isoform X2 [Hyla sarda]|uniref:F-box only protein 16 isoform X2 n=1 Tax=Hyla sarda TaxID=327740 RepID=UPI0024C293B9|nr:F-box only protein 16 isoform X2 [Hyla sarda]